ncbi:alpha/beta hydrolase [Lentilactobacillus parabuchneri]|uniref:alpha/beta hydrolase n=1 Tax=Lentilactobacillus parabuchneri TaxID=152331 RepID=UPI003995AEB4
MTNLVTKTDVEYDPINHQLTDIYYDAEKAESKGAIIDIHGGGWFRGNKSKDADSSIRFVKAGYLVVTPAYRITPNAFYPAPLEDMDHLFEWLKKSDLPFNHDHIGAFGSSAGGNMTVELAIKYGIPIVSLSGILDIDQWLSEHQDVVAAEGDTSGFNSTGSANINQTGANDPFYKWFVTNYFNGRTDQYAEATPVHRVTDQTGQMYLANSLNEFVPTSGVLDMAKALTAYQIPYRTRMLSGSRHAKGYLDDVWDDVIRFFADTLD